MALQASFIADFTSFLTAVDQAEVKLRSFESGANKVEGSLTRMTDSFSGRRIISEATLMAEAVERSGGVATLTAAELQRVGARATEAAEKMSKLGVDVPPGLQKILAAVTPIPPQLTLADKAAGLLKSTFGQFTLAGLATQAISKLSTGVMEFIETGTKLPAVESSFERLNRGVNQNSAEMLAAMTKGTLGMVSNYDLMLGANKAMLLGLPVTTASMGELAKTATVLGRAMGKDATSSLDDLITALGRSSPLILDNLGLTVKVGEANEAYAQKLGKTVEQMTDAEKKMAFYEAAMEAARKKTQELGDQTLTLGEIAGKAWTKFGNVVSATAGSLNVSIGAILSDTNSFVSFLENVVRGGVGAALSLEAANKQLESMKRVGKDISLDTEARAAAAAAAAEASKKQAEALKEQEAAAKKVAEAQKELDSSGEGWRGTLEGINAATVRAVRGYLEAGVSQAALATVYGLTATQIKAVATALAEEEKALQRADAAAKKATEMQARGLDELNKLQAAYTEAVARNSVSRVDIELAQNDRMMAGIVARLNRAGVAEQEYADLVTRLSGQLTQSVMVDTNALRAYSRTALEEQAAKAEATYRAALESSGEFSSGAIEHFRQLAEEARMAAAAWGTSFDDAGDRVVAKAKAVLDTVRIYTEQMIASVMPLQQLSALDVQKMGGEAGLRKQLADIEAYYAKNPGARSGGSGLTGIASGDEAGYRHLLEMQVLYAQIKQYLGGSSGSMAVSPTVAASPLFTPTKPSGGGSTGGIIVNISGAMMTPATEIARMVKTVLVEAARDSGQRLPMFGSVS